MKITRISIIRALLLAEIVSMVISVAIYYYTPWPEVLHDYMESSDTQGLIPEKYILWFAAPILILYLVAIVGIWRDWSPSKYFYLATLILAVLTLLTSGPSVMMPLEEIFGTASYMASGALLLMLFGYPRIIDSK